jgi:hypothetical protein
MKCKLIREMEVAPGAMPQAFVAANATMRVETRNQRPKHVLYWKVGTVFDLPDSFYLVRMGCAIPEDDECRERADMSDEQMATAQSQYEKVRLGIHPDDYDIFDAGVIAGYLPDGSYKPGPNFHLLEAAADDEAAEVVTSKGPE